MSKLVTALEPKARLIAAILAQRIPMPAWQGYHTGERLDGQLRTADTVRFWRAVNPNAVLIFGFLRVVDIDGNPTGEDKIVSSDVIERHERLIQFDKPIKYTETVSHTFSRTQTVEEAAKEAWEVGAKASLSLAYGGVTGAFEASAKYGQELAHKASLSETTSDTISKTFELQGPVTARIVAERSTDTIVRDYEASPNIEAKLYFQDHTEGHSGARAYEWTDIETFALAAAGESPVDTDYSRFASSSPSYELFAKRPVADVDIEALRAPLAEPVQFQARYQTVNRQSLKAI